MDLDDELCLCFHVSKRKVANYLRIEQPKSASQLSECYGAGTGCGWCRGYLRRMFDEMIAGKAPCQREPSATEYAQARSRYVRGGGGTPPPGATPIQPERPAPPDPPT